jgi:tRNA A-37 threonylcarbamoyl transferase component Bud32/DNA-binding beta-propeller fold protein YncE
MAGQGSLIGGRYRLAGIIGEGGMGVVWHARDEVLDRDVAVKEVVFPLRLSEDDRRLACARGMREARAAARLSHPAVITVHDVIEHDDRPWIVMELFRAGSLADLTATGPLPVSRVARIGLEVLSGLMAAHAAGVIHRDVKPSNVLVDGSRAVLTDFGAATILDDPALTGTGMVLGTPAFLAPERARHGRTGPESDLWSLGATLYAAVEGHPPYTGEDSLAVLSALLTSDPEPHHHAGPLGPVLDGLLQPDPARRITASQAADMLATIAAAPSADRHPPTVPAVPPGHDDGQRGSYGQGAPTLTSAGIRQSGQADPGHRPASSPAAASALGLVRQEPTGRRLRRPVVLLAAGTSVAVAAVLAAVLVAMPGKNAAAGSRPPSAATSSHVTRPAVAPRPRPTIAPPKAPAYVLSYPQTGAILGVAFTPDGDTVATSTYDIGCIVHLWNPLTGRLTGTLSAPDTNVGTGLAIDPSAPELALSIYSGNICLFDLHTGKLTTTLSLGSQFHMSAVAFSPSGGTLAGAYGDSTYLWNPATGKLTATFHEAGSKSVSTVAFSPDGRILAAGTASGSVYLWSTATGALTATLHDPASQGVTDVAFSKGGTSLAVADQDGSTYLWRVATGTLTSTLKDAGGAEAVAFSPDGSVLAAAAGNAVYLWNTATGTLIATLNDPSRFSPTPLSVAFSPDGKILAFGDADGNAYLWDMSWLNA